MCNQHLLLNDKLMQKKKKKLSIASFNGRECAPEDIRAGVFNKSGDVFTSTPKNKSNSANEEIRFTVCVSWDDRPQLCRTLLHPATFGNRARPGGRRQNVDMLCSLSYTGTVFVCLACVRSAPALHTATR